MEQFRRALIEVINSSELPLMQDTILLKMFIEMFLNSMKKC